MKFLNIQGASHTAAFDIGFTPAKPLPDNPGFVYLLNSDEVSAQNIPRDAFVVYQGHHGDVGATYANVILPGSAFTEKAATFVNTEGRAQVTRAAVSPPGAAREDWKIIRALSEVCDKALPYDDIVHLRSRMAQVSPTLVKHDELQPNTFGDMTLNILKGLQGEISSTDLELPIKDFYMTDCISRASSTMAKCSQVFTKKIALPVDTEQSIAV
jgi:NADH dehydrogenase (ubiquinone) Fe-S protein 1